MTQAEVTKLVGILMACYPNARVPDGTVAAYEAFLVELDHERASQAVANIVRSSRFMPTIAEVILAYDAVESRAADDGYPLLSAPRRQRGEMKPRELKSAIDAYLKGTH